MDDGIEWLYINNFLNIKFTYKSYFTNSFDNELMASLRFILKEVNIIRIFRAIYIL